MLVRSRVDALRGRYEEARAALDEAHAYGRPGATELRDQLTRHDITIRSERITRLEGDDGRLRRIHFESGPALERSALFFCTGQRQRSDLAARIGAQYNEKGTVDTHGAERTTVPGLWVAGDASKDAQLVIVAAAEGAAAAVAINTELNRIELAR